MKKGIIVLIIIIICGYFGYKGYILHKYHSSYENIINTSKIFDKTIKVLDNYNNQISMNSLIDGTFLPGYKRTNEEDYMYALYDEFGEVKSFYAVYIMPEYINFLSYDYEMIVDKEEYVQDNAIKKFLKDNSINNDIDLLYYIKNHYYCKSNIFNSIKTIKNNYMINEYVNIAMSEFESIDLIDNNYGYIININDSMKEIHLLHNNKEYTIFLRGDDLISDSFIEMLISSLVFDN